MICIRDKNEDKFMDPNTTRSVAIHWARSFNDQRIGSSSHILKHMKFLLEKAL